MNFLLTQIDEFWDTPTNLVEKMNDLKRKLKELNALKEDTESRMSIELHPRKKLKKEVELWFRKVERMNCEIQDLEQKFGESNVVSQEFFKRNVFKKIQEVEELFQQGNPANLDEKMNDLKRKREVLYALKEDMELHPRKKRKKEVELWFRDVERINGEIQDLEQKFGEGNVVSRGILKGNVFKKLQEVEELFHQGKFHDSVVVDNPGWIRQAISTTTLFGEAANCMKEIWTYLMSANVQKIGVWGMGGIGKTTIMKLVHNQLLKETGKFNDVIWITVSKAMNISELQKNIARGMNVLLYEDEDVTIRAERVHDVLALKGKYVLILDDLWDKLSLEEVGIPEPSDGSKLLVTTRSLDVCRHLGCREVRVPTLSKPNAWELFLEKVGQDVLNHPDLLPIVKSVAEECAGLPLAIVTIASSMKGVRDIHEWRNAVRELNRNIKSVNGMEEKVFLQLQFSYDRLLDEKVKNCFLCCALYPKDFEIDTDELIKLWIAEGFVEDMDSMRIEIEVGHTILNKLKNSCLIEDGNSGGVKLHGIVRGMALRITSVRPRFLVRAGMQLKEILDVKDWYEDLEKASLMENSVLQIPSQMPAPNCPKLTTLLLSNSNIESIPECFFEQMHVLKILDLSYNCIKSLPNSISNLKTLTTLLLGWCRDLEKVPSFSKLEALNKLDLGFTKIKDIPHEMERLVNLKYLDLSWTGIKEMGDGILEKFTSLQLLNLDDMLMRGEEVGGLKKLEFLSGRFYDLNEWNNYVQTLAQKRGLCQYAIFVGPVNYALLHERDKVIGLNGCRIRTDDIKIPSNVEELNIFKCIDDWCEEGAFLSRFIPVPINFFSSLSRIQIIECKNIKKVFSSNWVLHNLQNLVELIVVGCEEMEEIISSELEEEGISCDFIFTLPRLRRLVLWNLPELKSICGANGVMVCDSIQHIDILECPKIKRIPLNLPLQDDGQPSPPPSLISIQVYPAEWWKLVEWDHPNAKSMLEPFISEVILAKFTSSKKLVRGEEKGGLSKSEIFKSFNDLNDLNNNVQDLHELRQYRIYVGHQAAAENESYAESEKFIELNGCNICKDGSKILSDVEELRIESCIVDSCEEEAFLSRFILVPRDIFSSLSRIEIIYCQNIKKLFSSNWVLHNLQNLNILCVRGCKEIEEIIASESKLEEEVKFTLPKLCWLELYDLPELKSVCSASGVMVCDSIEKIYIGNCPNLKRIPLNLPLRDDGQPSPPPFLRTINVYPEEWWELVEWDHPNVKSLLEPYVENWPVL